MADLTTEQLEAAAKVLRENGYDVQMKGTQEPASAPQQPQVSAPAPTGSMFNGVHGPSHEQMMERMAQIGRELNGGQEVNHYL